MFSPCDAHNRVPPGPASYIIAGNDPFRVV